MPEQQKATLMSLTGLLFQAGIVVLGMLVVWLFDIPLALDGLSVASALLWGCLGGVLTYGVLLAMSRLDVLSPDTLQRHLRDLHRFVRSQRWPVLIGLAVLAGIGEELLFRGAIQGGVTGLAGHWTGIVAGALAFGLAHALSVAYFLVATTLGLLFGLAYELSDSLVLVMVWHAAYDLVVMAVLRWFPGLFGLLER